MFPVLRGPFAAKKQPERMPARGLNLLVFRDTRKPVSGSALRHALAVRLRFRQTHFDSEETVAALLQAGELECAFADSGAPTTQSERITDAIAAALANAVAPRNVESLLADLECVPVPPRMAVAIPEGFAFYGLHPLAFADVLDRCATLSPRVAVVGIRSIGTTLSAVTTASLQKRGIRAARITVRPTGHPYNRYLEFSSEELGFVRRENSRGGMFLVVDEGPGLSGSSFLSVAEALVRAGVSTEKITLLCSHKSDPDALCTENAATRWRQFRSLVASRSDRPADAQIWIGGGEWRRQFMADESQWPDSWLSFERMKYLSGKSAEQRFHKFAGFGRYGEEILQREATVAEAGFGLLPKKENAGYVSYPRADGRPMTNRDLSPEVLNRIAAYCAFRAQAFPAERAETRSQQEMAGHNLQEMKLDLPLNLSLEHAVIPDGRMQPHEWLLTTEGQMLKTDSGGHGDDHFFPGAADIAWDLAGAIVEWEMDAEEAETFLAVYGRKSGDDAQNRIADYLTAYSVFRCAYCLMAANAMRGTGEQLRLEQTAKRYRTGLMQCDLAPR